MKYLLQLHSVDESHCHNFHLKKELSFILNRITFIIHNEEKDQFQVKYFTNDQTLQSEIPQTMEDWRKEFSEYKIVM